MDFSHLEKWANDLKNNLAQGKPWVGKPGESTPASSSRSELPGPQESVVKDIEQALQKRANEALAEATQNPPAFTKASSSAEPKQNTVFKASTYAVPADMPKAAPPAAARPQAATPSGETITSPDAKMKAKKSEWLQLFSTIHESGQTARVAEHEKSLRALHLTTKDMFEKYKTCLSSEDELFRDSYTEALRVHLGGKELPEEAKKFLQDMQQRHGGDLIATPDSNIAAQHPHWAQVFSIFQEHNQGPRVFEFGKSLGRLRKFSKEAFEKYRECLAREDELFNKVYMQAEAARGAMKKKKLDDMAAQKRVATESQDYVTVKRLRTEMEQVEFGHEPLIKPPVPKMAPPLPMPFGPDPELAATVAYQQAAIALQMQAHQELEVTGWELAKSNEEAALKASRTAGDIAKQHGTTSGGIPYKRLPKRHGMAPCSFYMKTGDCSYGLACKWDHPDREDGPKCLRCGEFGHYGADCPKFGKRNRW